MNIFTYQKNVTTSGTPVQLQDQTVDPNQSVVIKAKRANTGTICFGRSSAEALNSDTKHYKLAADQSVTVSVSNLNQIWIDSTVNGEGVEVTVGGQAGGGGGGSNTTADTE